MRDYRWMEWNGGEESKDERSLMVSWKNRKIAPGRGMVMMMMMMMMMRVMMRKKRGRRKEGKEDCELPLPLPLPLPPLRPSSSLTRCS